MYCTRRRLYYTRIVLLSVLAGSCAIVGLWEVRSRADARTLVVTVRDSKPETCPCAICGGIYRKQEVGDAASYLHTTYVTSRRTRLRELRPRCLRLCSFPLSVPATDKSLTLIPALRPVHKHQPYERTHTAVRNLPSFLVRPGSYDLFDALPRGWF